MTHSQKKCINHLEQLAQSIERIYSDEHPDRKVLRVDKKPIFMLTYITVDPSDYISIHQVGGLTLKPIPDYILQKFKEAVPQGMLELSREMYEKKQKAGSEKK